jgi:hypothetical protein
MPPRRFPAALPVPSNLAVSFTVGWQFGVGIFMAREPWQVPDPPASGDANSDITFCAVGKALSQWEWFEGNLSLAFSYLIGSGYGNLAALRAYGSILGFQSRAGMIERAAEVYFKYNKIADLQSAIEQLLIKSRDRLSARRNDIAHGIVQPYANAVAGHNGYVLYPAYYATKKRKLPDDGALHDVKPTFIYSSIEIENFGKQFSELSEATIEILTELTRHEQGRVHRG